MHLRNLTPPYLLCNAGFCPAVYRTEDNKLVIIGTKASESIKQTLRDKVNVEKEDVVIIDDAFFEQVEAYKKAHQKK